MPARPAHNPARFVPVYGVGFTDPAGAIEAVSSESPLPVALSPPTAVAPLEGSAATDAVAGPFVPSLGSPVTVVFAGEWSGAVRVVRSTDGGATRHPLTIGGSAWARFTANACEQVWQEYDPAAALFLDIALSTGTLVYRMGH